MRNLKCCWLFALFLFFFAIGNAYAAPAEMQLPTPGALYGTSVTFEWSDVGADAYALQIGSTAPGSHDLYDGYEESNLSAIVSGLPSGGETLYVRLGAYSGGEWENNDYIYTACASPEPPAEIQSPAPGSTLYGTNVSFEWDAANADGFELYVGASGPGSNDLYSGSVGTATSKVVGGLPNNGETVYVTLVSIFGGTYFYNDYVFVACASSNTPAGMMFPNPGEQLYGTSVTFEWNDAGAVDYALQIGTTGAGSYDIYDGYEYGNLSKIVAGLPSNGQTLYVRLSSYFGGQQYNDYVYTACDSPEPPVEITSPSPESTLSGTSVSFEWDAANADGFELYVGTSGPGSNDLYSGSVGTATSKVVGGLPNNGETVYVTLVSVFGGTYFYNDYVFVACASSNTPADMMFPNPGEQLYGTSVTFEWNDAGAVDYALQIGTTGAGSYDIYDGYEYGNLSKIVAGLPSNGQTLYVRLSSYFGGQQYNDYVYTACDSPEPPAEMTGPAPESTLSGTSVSFEWDAANADNFELYVGTSGPGSNDLYSGNAGAATSKVVGGLPNNGETVYVTLVSVFGGTYYYNDYFFTACASSNTPADMMFPTPGDELYGTSVTFEWNDAGAVDYALQIGTTGAGSYDIYDGYEYGNLSKIVAGLPSSGQTLYVRLSSYFGGQQYNDYVYTACTSPSPPAEMIEPVSESVLPGTSVAFQWNDSGADEYRIWAGVSGPGSIDLHDVSAGTDTSKVLDGLPNNSETVYVTLISIFNGSYYYNDYVFTACASSSTPAAITFPTQGYVFDGTSQSFEWEDVGANQYGLRIGTAGPGSGNIYDADQGLGLSAVVNGLPNAGETVYARLSSLIGGTWYYNDYIFFACETVARIQSPSCGSTLGSTTETFTWNNTAAEKYWLWVGTSAGGNDLYNKDQGTATSAIVSGLPESGETLYVRIWSKVNGEFLYAEDCVFTAHDVNSQVAAIETPASGTALSSTTVTFTWNDTGAEKYWLNIGTSAGGDDLYGKDQASNTSAVVAGLPESGETLYVRLWSKVDGNWLYAADCTYTAVDSGALIAEIQSPVSGATFSSATETFTWNDTGAEKYWLFVGTSAGGNDLYSKDQATGTSAVVAGLPEGGETVYVRLWSKVDGEWLYGTDCTYTAFDSGAMVAEIQSPTPGTAFSSTTETFTWNDTGAEKYWLWVGISAGGNELHNKGYTTTSAAVSGLPNAGEDVYVRLWSRVDGEWLYVDDCVYTAVGP